MNNLKEQEIIELVIKASQMVLKSFATTPWTSQPRDEFEASHNLHVRSLEALRMALRELSNFRGSSLGK